MPRGFLVKRRDYVPYSYRQRRNSVEDPSDSGSDHDFPMRKLASPVSVFSLSPTTLTFRDNEFDGESSSSSTPTSPVSGVSTPVYGSPFFSTFDRLTLSSPKTFIPPATSPPNLKKRENTTSDKQRSPKKPKAARKLNFDEDLTSPVSGTVIRPPNSDTDEEGHMSGDIDSSLNWVDVSPEARAELAKIDNKIGDYVCMLCKEQYEDAFMLAQHKCSRIVYVEYRCPECDKVFNCPANLASHRRWHKPRPNGNKLSANRPILPADVKKENDHPSSPTSEGCYECETCGRKFKRRAYLRKHRAKHAASKTMSSATGMSNSTKSMVDYYNSAMNTYRCSLCSASFPDEHVLESHHRRQHMSESPIFSCRYCKEHFFSSPALSQHMSKCHPVESTNNLAILPGVMRTG